MNTSKLPFKSLQVALSQSDYDLIKSLVKSGHYADESEVIRDGLRLLKDRGSTIAKWIRQEVIRAYDELKADPTLGMSVNQLRIALAKRRVNQAK